MRTSIHRPSWIEVDLAAISYNLKTVMQALPQKTAVFGVIKANAYGHGVIAVAETLAPLVDGFCVSNIDEALELREAGFEQEILVLGVSAVSAIPLAIEKQIQLAVTSLEWVDLALESQADLSQLGVHLKLDTGMGRIGFRDSQSANQAITLLQEKGVTVEGIFTHFATADQKDEEQFHAQLARFKELLSKLKIQPRWIHASNSATSIWHSETVFNMVRLGDILYGLNPSGRELALPYPIQPALSLYSELVQVKTLPAGSSVGYGATYVTEQEEYVGTIPIGYADGVIRAMQGFQVLVDGQLCPIIGRVSMDQITLRLPKGYPIGTRVTLIGQDGNQTVSAQDWADKLGTINYEVVCLLSDRLPRKYKER